MIFLAPLTRFTFIFYFKDGNPLSKWLAAHISIVLTAVYDNSWRASINRPDHVVFVLFERRGRKMAANSFFVLILGLFIPLLALGKSKTKAKSLEFNTLVIRR
jgi:hypothetical protein